MTGEAEVSLSDHYCFGCGRRNPLGLHLEFTRDGDEIVARYTPREEDQGFPGRMHGGIAAVLLDEAMGWVLYIDRVLAVTAKMETRFRAAIPLDHPLEVRAGVQQRSVGGWRIGARLLDDSGVTLAEATGLFLPPPPEEAEIWRAGLGLDTADELR